MNGEKRNRLLGFNGPRMHSSIPKVIHLPILWGSANPLGVVLGALLYQEGDKVVWWSHEVDLVEKIVKFTW